MFVGIPVIPTGTLYGEISTSSRHTGKPIFRFKDVCKCDSKTRSINPANWETQDSDLTSWMTAIRTRIRTSERLRREQWEEKKVHKKQMT